MKKKLDTLQIGSFLSKEGFGLDLFSIEPSIVRVRKLLYPKEFKTVSKHLVRIK